MQQAVGEILESFASGLEVGDALLQVEEGMIGHVGRPGVGHGQRLIQESVGAGCGRGLWADVVGRGRMTKIIEHT